MRRARNAGRTQDSHVWPTERALKEKISDRYSITIHTEYPVRTQVNEARKTVKPILTTLEINAKSLFCQPFSANCVEAKVKIDAIILNDFSDLECNFEILPKKNKQFKFYTSVNHR